MMQGLHYSVILGELRNQPPYSQVSKADWSDIVGAFEEMEKPDSRDVADFVERGMRVRGYQPLLTRFRRDPATELLASLNRKLDTLIEIMRKK